MADDIPGPVANLPQRLAGVFTRSLSARLLGLTTLFVLLAEVLIFAPSLGNYHRSWLQEHVNAAQIAALALDAAPGERITENLRRELLENAEVSRVALKRDGKRELRLDATTPDAAPVIHTIDLRDRSPSYAILNAFDSFFAPRGRELRVLATPRFETGEFIEIVIAEAPLKRDMNVYAVEAFQVSLLISLITGVLLYVTLHAVFVRPMRQLTAQIEHFRDAPEDASATAEPSRREDEIGRAERALAQMEAQVRAALRQRERLAALGLAVAKLAHDLRNSLATASLVTEQLGQSADPRVRQSAPRLERAIARAASLAEAALRYGRAEEPAAKLETIQLAAALREAGDDALGAHPQIAWRVSVPEDAAICADREHLHRVVTNLLRNAAQALSTTGRDGAIEARLARVEDGRAVIEIADDGPGLREGARERLFEPFAATTARGAGLGLTIARELARGMGGDLDVASSGPDGAVFALSLRTAPALAPARP